MTAMLALDKSATISFNGIEWSADAI